MKGLIYILPLLILFVACDKEDDPNNAGCPPFSFVPTSPYEDPVWHPSGSIIGFNHTPIKEIHYTYGYNCPMQANYTYETDSTGFWLVNADGSNKRRILPQMLQNPSWSPDGKWIAFVRDAQIFKMPFDGEKFDTTSIIQLTMQGRNFFPAWSPDGKWIAYDSDHESPSGLKFIWKMKSNGSSNKRVTFTPNQGETRMPTWNKNFHIVHQRFIGITYPEIFEVDSTGNVIKRLTNNINYESYPQFSPDGNHIAFLSQSNSGGGTQVWSMESDGTNLNQLTTSGATGFSWSPKGEMVYASFNYMRIDEREGTLWVMDGDGNHKRQLTSNKFKLLQ